MKLKIVVATVLLLAIAGCSSSPATSQPEAAPAFNFAPQAMTPLAGFDVDSARDPRLAVRAASGSVYLMAVLQGQAGPRLGLTRSDDGGDSFAPPEYISEPDARVSSHGENSPSFAFGLGREQYALFEQMAAEGLTDLMFARSPIGHGWEKPYKITDKKKPSANVFSGLAVSPRGSVHAVWLDQRDSESLPPGTAAVYIASSSDRGESFGPNIPVAAGVCPCCRPSLAFGAKGEIYVSWRHVFEGNERDIAVAVSTDGGKSFGEPGRVSPDGWKVQGCPHSGAEMVQRDGRLYITWYSDGDGKSTPSGVRLAWSDDSAKTFAEPVIASQNVLDSNHPRLSLAPDGRLGLVFQGRDPLKNDGWSPTGAFVVDIAPNGSLSAPVAVPGHTRTVNYPSVAYGSVGRLFVAWSEEGPDGRTIYFNRARGESVPGSYPGGTSSR
ncbi:MAG TPA: sialidase family protein [Bryobacterales bacterium]|nr:sialidase family protein [Bryobacterales bacterium]